ncbi:hypothetical protein RQP46_007634 [Phenoliferia psychrophenolica]
MTSNLLLCPALLSSLPSLVNLELLELYIPISKKSISAIGASAPDTLRRLTLSGSGITEDAFEEVLAVLVSPVLLTGLLRLELPTAPKDRFAGETGLKVLDECAKRQVSLTCCYGYLTRSMMNDEETMGVETVDVMATIDSLAPELLSEIFEHLWLGQGRNPATRLSYLSAPTLLDVLAKATFPLVRHLVLDDSTEFDVWPNVIGHFPSLITLEIMDHTGDDTAESLFAVGASVPATLQNLLLNSFRGDDSIILLLRIIKLPNLAGLHRIEVPMTPKSAFENVAGLALLDECEERSITLLCRYGYV